MIFVDTSAFLAVLDAAERRHQPARVEWERLLTQGTALFTSNYVVFETTALAQHRLGMDAARLFHQDILPVIGIVWIDEELHMAAVAALFAANRRGVSLVDCSSFALMRRHGIAMAFAFDAHFQEQGFEVAP